jgi:hypothetical protein
MTTLKQLDNVLDFLYKNNNRNVPITEIYKEFLELENADIKAILKKLNDDHYIIDAANGSFTIFAISFDGKLLKENGGYVQKKINDESVLRLRDSRDKRLSNGTVYLAIGTFLLMVWEILKTCYFHAC